MFQVVFQIEKNGIWHVGGYSKSSGDANFATAHLFIKLIQGDTVRVKSSFTFSATGPPKYLESSYNTFTGMLITPLL